MKKQQIKEYEVLKEYFEKIKNLLQSNPSKNGDNYAIILGRVSGLVICCEMELENIKKKGS